MVISRPILRTLGIASPSDRFPATAFDEINQRVSRRTAGAKAAWHAFAMAWNGIVYRLNAANWHIGRFSKSIAVSDAPGPAERLEQENDLFIIACALQSAVECTFFASKVVVDVAAPNGFAPSRDADLRFSPKVVAESLQRTWPGAAITDLLINAQASKEFVKISDLRRVVFHRGSLPRQVYFSTGPTVQPAAIPSSPALPADQWDYNWELSPSMLTPLLTWTDAHIEATILTLDEFTKSW